MNSVTSTSASCRVDTQSIVVAFYIPIYMVYVDTYRFIPQPTPCLIKELIHCVIKLEGWLLLLLLLLLLLGVSGQEG